MTERQPNIPHWTDDEIIAHLYEVGPQHSGQLGHLSACPTCQARLEAIQARRQDLAVPLDVDERRLAAQRSRIETRIHRHARPRIVFWAPAAAATAAVVLGIAFFGPGSRESVNTVDGAASSPTVVDETFYTDIYYAVATDAPGAVAPINGMFEASRE